MKMAEAVLISLTNISEIIRISSTEFSMGRSLTNSLVLVDVCVSRCQCVINFQDDKWTITDKSTNGTTVNSLLLQNKTCEIHDNDIIQLSDTTKYSFHIDPVIPNKKRRMEALPVKVKTGNNNPASVEEISNTINECSIIDLTKSVKDEQVWTCRAICKLKKLKINWIDQSAENKVLERVIIQNANTILELEVDLFNKTAHNVALDERNIELRQVCDVLEKEKEEIQLQVLDMEYEITTLKMKLGKQTSENNESSKQTEGEDSNVEDKKLLDCLLRAEIFEKECLVKSNINKTVMFVNSLGNENCDYAFLKKQLSDLQTDLDELISKRNELEHSSRADTPIDDIENKTKDKVVQLMESELQCSVCNELFVKPTVLNCKHTFCNMCILFWRKQKNNCPVCRVPIKTIVECRTLDTYIDQAVCTLSPSKKEDRLKLRETYEASCKGLKANRSNTDEPEPTIYINLSSESDSDDNEDDTDYSPDVYYGGYGQCYICGARGHWANGCPNRRNR